MCVHTLCVCVCVNVLLDFYMRVCVNVLLDFYSNGGHSVFS